MTEEDWMKVAEMIEMEGCDWAFRSYHLTDEDDRKEDKYKKILE